MQDVREKLDWFKTVILPHEAALRARVRRHRNGGEIDDLVAETLTRAYANPHWRRVDRGRGYLFAIAHNLVIDQIRRERVVPIETLVDVDQLRSATDLEAELGARDALRRLQRALDSLPPRCRRAFVLRRLDEKSFIDVAEAMGLSVSTVEKHVVKATRSLMRALAEREDDERDEAEQARADRGDGGPPVARRRG